MESYEILRDLAIILLFAKCFGILARKDRLYHADGGSRRDHIDVFCRAGVRLEGTDQNRPGGFSDRLCRCICSACPGSTSVHGLLRHGTLGQ